ncbi:MAG: phosphoglucosamine mutase, partial [Planctomycetota bacterium]
SWFKQQTGKPDPQIVVGRDSRPSGAMIEAAAVAGLVSVGCRVTALGIVSTPGVAIMAEQLQADGGVVITASHNPIIWNGIKVLRHDGMAPPADQARQIIARYHNSEIDYAPVEDLHPVEHNGDTHRVHVDRALSAVDADAIRQLKPKVVLDSVHGAGGTGAAILLRELGAELVHLYGEPTGRFPHTPEPLEENLTELADAVRTHNADVGFAQDPDADRLAIVDNTGRYIGEEYTLVLGAMNVLRKTPGPVAANLSTSRMIDDLAATYGQPVHRTPVGEANVVEAMRRENCPVGGEGGGGIICPQVVSVRDSFAGIALTLELLAQTQQPLDAIIDAAPAYAIVKDKLPIQEGMAEQAIASLAETFADQRVDTRDGIRIDLDADKAWVHLRPSNTEPILRIIAEAPEAQTAQDLIARVRTAIGAG